MIKYGDDCRYNDFIVIRPLCEYSGRSNRLNEVLEPALCSARDAGIRISLIEKVNELCRYDLRQRKILFAIRLSEAGVNMEYYRLLEYFRKYPGCLSGSVGGIIVDGSGELYTKALARRLAFSANMAGCTFPGKPLVEATGSLGNFHVLSTIREVSPLEAYSQEVNNLISRVNCFEILPLKDQKNADRSGNPKILALHAGSHRTSNSLLLWEKVKTNLDSAKVTDISLRNGTVQDCRGCSYEACLHFGENDSCFYGGIMTEQVYPALIDCDSLVMVCPNYNDAIGANLTAFINRLTALFRTRDFSNKRIYGIIVSGYSGGDIVAEQIIGALNFNKAFVLPERFALIETANDPGSVNLIPGIELRASEFAKHIEKH